MYLISLEMIHMMKFNSIKPNRKKNEIVNQKEHFESTHGSNI